MLSLLQQVRLLDPIANRDEVVDVLIDRGMIRSIAPHITDIPSDAQVQPCQGLILGPGLVDLYSHSGEPGFEERDTLESLMQAAIAGGFTRLNILPTTQPAIDHPAAVSWLKTKTHPIPHAPSPIPKVNCWGALTIDAKGQQLTELFDLVEADVTGLSDGKPISNLALLRRAMEYLQPLGKAIALYACEPSLAGNGLVREGANALRFGLPGIPVMAEAAPLSAILECIAEIGTPVHLMRISTARGVELIRDAKAKGLPITASTTWMHLLLHTEALGSYDPSLRLDPPIGNPTDQAALIEAVKTGVIDAIAIDHTPYTYEEKTVSFGEAPAGTIGLELALPLLWQTFVASGQWSALELWRALSDRPARCLGNSFSAIEPNIPANVVLFDPEQTWTVEARSLNSLSSNTVWLDQNLTGRIVQVWC